MKYAIGTPAQAAKADEIIRAVNSAKDSNIESLPADHPAVNAWNKAYDVICARRFHLGPNATAICNNEQLVNVAALADIANKVLDLSEVEDSAAAIREYIETELARPLDLRY